MEVLTQENTILATAGNYGAGIYGAGVYGGVASNYVVLYPQPFGVVWEPDSILVSTSSQSFTTAAAYLDTTEVNACVGITIDGNQGEIDLPAIEITANHRLIVVWFGGDANASASATLIGTEGNLNE